MTTFDKIKKLAKERGLSLTKLNDKAKLGTNSIYHWKHKSPSAASLSKVAKVLNVSVDYLLSQEEKSDIRNPSNLNLDSFTTYDNNVRYAPIYGTIKAGPGGFAYEDHEGTMIVGGKHALTNHKLIWLRVSGDSMTGDGIHNDDLALIDTDAECECNGEILAVVYDGVFGTLKHVTKNKGAIVLSASNPIYKPIILNGSDLDNFKIVGKAVSIQRDI